MEKTEAIRPVPLDTAPFEAEFRRLLRDARGLIVILKSAKGLEGGQDGQLYRMTLKRFRDGCLRLASMAESISLLLGDGERDRILAENGCRWDDDKKRVSIG